MSQAMSQYPYSPLSTGCESIRLLRLMPHKDETAPIQCELFEYSLQESSKGTHLYEALSYVWGSSDTPKSISIGKHNLPVTANLYAALSRLRDYSFERIIWADFVCINQGDEKEKERQIQLMAKIYGQANRVVVYLGEAVDDSDQALEDIRVAAEDESTILLKSERSQKAILKLLERPWFQRIWVLQEVAAARRILMVYGCTEINGHAFCSGFSKLELSYTHPDLQSLIRSVTYLIRGAVFRPKYAKSPTSGLSLGELLDMYHTRKSTVPNDKVYALLGMTSDDPNAAGLLPDYTVPWKTLLQRLIEFVLSKEVSVETWDKREMAVIKSKGYILGYVSLVEDDSARYDRQHVEVVFNNTPKSLEYGRNYGTRWTLQASAKSIRKRDVICLLQGASKPTILRTYKDHFSIIMIAVTLRQSVGTESRYIERQDPVASANILLRDLLLVWNWEKSQANLQDQVGDETSGEINTLVPEYLKTASDKAARSCNVALALGDSEESEGAEKKLQEVIESCERALGKGNTYTLAAIDGLALLYWSKEQWKKAEDQFLKAIQTRKRVQGIDHPDTLSRIADLASIYIKDDSEDGGKPAITSLVDRIRDNAQITEEDMVQVATSFGKGMVRLLLEFNIRITTKVVEAAAGNAYRGQGVMALLLDQRGDEVKITEEVVKAAAGNACGSREIMALLLNQRGDEVKITEEVVKAVAGNENNSEETMALLLDRRGDEVKITEEVLKTAASNQVTWIMALLLDQRGDEVKITEEVVKAAVRNYYNGKDMMALLLDRRGDEVKITEEIVKATAGNERSGKEIMALLLDQRGDEVKITEEVVKAAAGNERQGKQEVQLLYQRVGFKITVGMIEAAATSGQEEVLNLFDQWESIGSDKERWLNISRLYNAAKRGDAVTVRQLVADGTPPDQRNIRGATPLWQASQSGYKQVVEVLLATNAVDVNVQSISGRTPLFWAAANGHSEVVRLLLDHGAEANYTDEDGRSPLSIAQARCQDSVVAMLRRHKSTM